MKFGEQYVRQIFNNPEGVKLKNACLTPSGLLKKLIHSSPNFIRGYSSLTLSAFLDLQILIALETCVKACNTREIRENVGNKTRYVEVSAIGLKQ